MRKAVFLLLIIAIFLSGCIGASDEKIAQEIADCISHGASSGKTNSESCILQAAIKFQDEKICGNISVEPLKDGCIIAVAVAKEDAALCGTISNEIKNTSSQDKMCKAMITLDTKYCDEITTAYGFGEEYMRGSCYAYIIQKKNNPSICANAKTNAVKGYCIIAAANATHEIKYCDELPDGSDKGECYGIIAENKKNPELCEKLETNFSKGYCYRAAIKILGGPKSVGWCEILPGKYESETCLKSYFVSTGNWHECAKLPIESNRLSCYADAAAISKDPQGCEKSSGDFRDRCLIKVAEARQDLNICGSISENYRKYVPVSGIGYCSAFFQEK